MHCSEDMLTWGADPPAAGRAVTHCSTASVLIIHRKSQYTLYNTALCRWSFLIHLAPCHSTGKLMIAANDHIFFQLHLTVLV